MSLGRDEVLHVARLAELAVPLAEVERLVEQFNHILDYVARLDEVRPAGGTDVYLAGPASVMLREDVEDAVPLVRPPAAIAPEFADGFFLVPRHGAMEDR